MDRTDHEYIRLLSEASIVFALWWTGQPHNSKVRMAQKDLRCEQWGTSRISGFCLRRHAVHATPRAVFAGYDHNGRKNMWMKAPSASCVRRYVQLVAMLSYIYILEVSYCKRQSRAESPLQIENRRKEQHSELAVKKSSKTTWFLSPFIRQVKIDVFLLHYDFSSWKLLVISLNFEESSATNKAHSRVAGIFRRP